MYSIDTLFALVQSLTKSEKRYFRLCSDMQKGEKSYLQLFDFLEKQPTLDRTLAEDLRKLFPGTSIEPARKHLYRALMKSLRQYDADKEVEVRLMNALHDSRILYQKGLVKASLEQLDKIKAQALRLEKHMLYILAARQELQYLAHLQFIEVNEDQLIEKQNKIKELLEQELRLSQYASLYEVLLLRYWKQGVVRSQQEVTELNDLLLEEYQILNRPGEMSFKLQQLHLHFQSTYFQMLGNVKSSLGVFYDLDDLFQRHELLWKDAPLYYVYVLDGILSDLRWMEQYHDMDFFLNRLQEISASESLDALVRCKVLEHQLKRCVDQRQFEEAGALLTEHTLALKRDIPQIPFQMRSHLQYTIARVWLCLGEYSKALRLINSELNLPSTLTDQSSRTIFLLLNLQVNALMDNTDYLLYAMRSMERKLKSERKLFGVEQLLLTILKRWLAFKPLKGYHEKLEALADNPYEKRLITELCLGEWLGRIKAKKRLGTF